MSRQPGLVSGVFSSLFFVWDGFVLGDDHSLMGGSDDTWSSGVVGLFG